MKYIIMAGGDYPKWRTPRQLLEIHGEAVIARTIRLLRAAGVTDISISSNNDAFEQLGVPVLRHENDYIGIEYNNVRGSWCNAFYQTDEPTCYIFGDVVFSPNAIRTIVGYETDDIMLFGSKFPFAPEYPKPWIEPFAFKVFDTDHLKAAVEEVKRLDRDGRFDRRPIAWEVWNVICGGDPNTINQSYVGINDYTCDIDYQHEVPAIEAHVPREDRMATKKTEPKKAETKKTTKKITKKKDESVVEYRGKLFTVMERNDDRVLLTDGTIHFWARAKDVTAAD